MKAVELYQSAVHRLKDAHIEDAEIEASILLGHLLHLSRARIFLHTEELPAPILHSFEQHLRRRLAREPLSYILEEQEFWSLPFYVNRDVLIPRPETEILLEMVLQVLKGEGRSPCSVLDMGTGSGIIAIILALSLPQSFVASLDISFAAQAVARKNAERHGVLGRVSFINSDWLEGIRLAPLFDLVVTNPPYVAHETLDDLQPEVSLFEPRLALDGGRKGMEEICRFAGDLSVVLKPGGLFFMEIGFDQAPLVMDLFSSFSEFDGLTVYEDYAGLPRIFHARRL
ncbi:MAG: peptide chain release factor N(5)-glutamine methyltransferase [Deltaproteobacteria bacterium]|nr:peptide chain release factor N(5)-glutamine methyltransferase [Deltaproteobacteria bacterium]